MFDCLRSNSFRHGLAIADSALRVSGDDVEQFLEEFGRFHKCHAGHWRACEIMRLADARAENGGESIARAVMIEQGFMMPDLQVEVPNPVDPTKKFRVDFYWQLESGNIYGELDGHDKYIDPAMTNGRSTVQVLTAERLRESRISGTGAKIMRFSYNEAVNTPYFCNLLNGFGVPGGYEVPAVANGLDPINAAGLR